jgi:hypothetical protein
MYHARMNFMHKADGVLEGAEAELKTQVQEALDRGDYSSVKALAELAKSLATLRKTLPGVMQVGDDAPGTASGVSNSAGIREAQFARTNGALAEHQTKTTAALSFPRFERHGKRLIKLGWSSKDKRVYEQRAPYEVVVEICRQFGERAGVKKLLKLEKLLPMKTEEGDEIPSYQVYLVLKWLQQNGAVMRQGKDGYSLSEIGMNVKQLWEQTESK